MAAANAIENLLGSAAHGIQRRVTALHDANDAAALTDEEERDPAKAIAKWTRVLARTTDAKKNSADPFGDGDQSPIVARGPGDRGQSLVDVWASGADSQPLAPGKFTPFFRSCYIGDISSVQQAIQQARVQDKKETEENTNKAEGEGPKVEGGGAGVEGAVKGAEGAAAAASASPAHLAPPPNSHLFRLLERREGLLRMNPLLICIAGARCMGTHALPPSMQQHAAHLAVARALLSAGARAEAKDVAGYSCVHHCSTAMSNAVAHSIAQELFDRGASANIKNRAGRVPLMEGIMSNREDIVELLTGYGQADPSVKDVDGLSPMSLGKLFPAANRIFSAWGRRQALLAAGAVVVLRGLESEAGEALNNETARVVKYEPRPKRFMIELISQPGRLMNVRMENLRLTSEREEMEGVASSACANPNCPTHALGTKRCSRCLHISYCCRDCQTAHWSTHKSDCKKWEKESKVSLKPTPEVSAAKAKSHAAAAAAAVAAGAPISAANFSHAISVPWGNSSSDLASRGQPISLNGRASNAAEPGVVGENAGEMIVKVQVQQNSFGRPGNGAMLIYNQSRSLHQLMDSSHPQFHLVQQKVVSEGIMGGAKAYFYAQFGTKGALNFTTKQLAPIQDW